MEFLYLGWVLNIVSLIIVIYWIDENARDSRWLFRKSNLKIFWYYGKFIFIPFLTVFYHKPFTIKFKKYKMYHKREDSIDYFNSQIWARRKD